MMATTRSKGKVKGIKIYQHSLFGHLSSKQMPTCIRRERGGETFCPYGWGSQCSCDDRVKDMIWILTHLPLGGAIPKPFLGHGTWNPNLFSHILLQNQEDKHYYMSVVGALWWLAHSLPKEVWVKGIHKVFDVLVLMQ